MRYYGITKVIIPWTDNQGMRQWSVLTFSDRDGGGVDRRCIYKNIRKWAFLNFKKRVPKVWIRAQQIVNTYDPKKTLTPEQATEFDKALEAFYQKLEREVDEIEAGADTGSEAQNSNGAELQVSPLQT
jgi:hypothetical protein